jgi:hypothetical protein
MPIYAMNDGRAFTEYRPHGMFMSDLYSKHNLTSHRDFMTFMKNNTIEQKEIPDCSQKTCPVCQETLDWKPNFKK